MIDAKPVRQVPGAFRSQGRPRVRLDLQASYMQDHWLVRRPLVGQPSLVGQETIGWSAPTVRALSLMTVVYDMLEVGLD